MKTFKITRFISLSLVIAFMLVGLTSCKKKVKIDPINRIPGEIYCKVERRLGGVQIDAGAEVKGSVDQDGEKDVEVNSNLSFTLVNIQFQLQSQSMM